MVSSSLSLLALASLAAAAPAPLSKLRRRDAFSDLIASLTPSSGSSPVSVSSDDVGTLGLSNAAALSGAAYCVRDEQWDCPSCGAVPDMQLLYAAGDGEENPRMFVGWSAAMSAVVVAHEGTETNIEAWLGDLDAVQVDMDSSLDNGNAPGGIQVHEGFQDRYLNFSSVVLDQVNSALAGVGADAGYVLVTGHSLGGAMALLDGIHLRLALPSSVALQVTTFGQPRVGNEDFANYAASVLGDSFTHVTNDNDIVPRVPGTWLGYSQVITELWINDSGDLQLCPGLENDACSAGIGDFDLSPFPHLGPYWGTTMNSC